MAQPPFPQGVALSQCFFLHLGLCEKTLSRLDVTTAIINPMQNEKKIGATSVSVPFFADPRKSWGLNLPACRVLLVHWGWLGAKLPIR
jgi:hypothetical protein